MEVIECDFEVWQALTARRRSKNGAINNMTISTVGEQSHGIHPQSIVGGGGTVTVLKADTGKATAEARSKSSDKGGKITVDTAGSISTTGTDAHVIFAQSGFQNADGSLKIDTGRGSGIAITHDGRLVGGLGRGAAVRVDGGDSNTITFGANSMAYALSGTAVSGSFGNERVTNNGVLIGDTKVNGGRPKERNWFHNAAARFTAPSPAGSSTWVRARSTSFTMRVSSLSVRLNRFPPSRWRTI